MPVPPGASDVSFSYRLPYARDAYELNTGVVYPTATFWALVPANLSAASGELRAERVVDIGRQQYQLLVGQDLGAGQRVAVALAGLPFTPRPWPLEEGVQRGAALALTVLGVLAACAYAWRRGRVPASAGSPV
jgi:hypothetical protein